MIWIRRLQAQKKGSHESKMTVFDCSPCTVCILTQGKSNWLYLLSSITSQQVRKWSDDMQVALF